jgi:carboxypeptidase family protein
VSQTAAPALPFAGSVQDPAKAGVSGATVTLKRIGGADRQSTTADATGAFRFDGIVAGNYEIQVRHQGFKPFTSRVKIGPSAPPLIGIVLSLADVRQEITVHEEAAHVHECA